MKTFTLFLVVMAFLAPGSRAQQGSSTQTSQPQAQQSDPSSQPSTSNRQSQAKPKPTDCSDPKLIKQDGSKRSKLWEKFRSRVYQKTGEDPNSYVKPQGCPGSPAPQPLSSQKKSNSK